MQVAVIGANGQLGQDIVLAFRAAHTKVVELNHDRIEIADRTSVADALDSSGADLVVNTGAMHHVDRCEERPLQAFAVNALGVYNLAQECRARKKALLHVSTDYVFDGIKQTPYVESD